MPPLDRMRKIRRDIVKSINDYRELVKNPGVYQDTMANKVANEYAEYLLDNDEDMNALQEICNKHLFVGTVVPLVGISMLDDEE